MAFHTLIIKLSEIPEEGKSFKYDNKLNPELALELKDLIQKEPFQIELFIRPINSKDYVVTGKLETRSPQDCSRCGDDFKFPIKKSLNEVLIPKTGRDFEGKYTKPNHILQDSESSSVDYIEVKNEEFDVASYIHESIALDIPFNPSPELDDKQNCSLCHKSFEKGYFEHTEEITAENKNPFASLKGLKLN